MGNSHIGAYIQYDPTEIDENDPVSTHYTQSCIVNNLNHLSDIHGQVRAKFSAQNDDGGQGIPLTPLDATLRTDKYYELWSADFIAFVKPDGDAYTYRVRVGGENSAAAKTTVWRACVAPFREVPAHIREGSSLANVVEWSGITSTTPAWFSASTYLTVDASLVSAAMETLGTIDGVAGDPVSIDVPILTFAVWAKIDDGQQHPKLWAAVCEEHIGT